MYDFTLGEIAQVIQAELIGGDAQIKPLGASIDTRKLRPGQLFFALKGERTDGHHFLEQAFVQGAAGAVVNYLPPGFSKPGFPLLLVDDSERALQHLASVQRQMMKGPVIAITGSTGKTTTKDILASILHQKGAVLSTEGNYNNQLGLPLTLLSLEQKHWAIIVEMGMGGLGEIDLLAKIAKPTHGLITNIGHAHQEILGSQEKIAQAKAELFPYIPPEGGMVLNKQDQAILKTWVADLSCPVNWFDYSPPADLWASAVQVNKKDYGYTYQVNTKEEAIPMAINVPGKHNIINSLAAIGIARQLGLTWEEIRLGLSQVQLTSMRLEIIRPPGREITLINDAYNANPASMASSLEVLDTIAGSCRKIAILGDMYELGASWAEYHQEIGKKAKAVNPAYLITVGRLAQEIIEGALQSGFPKARTRSLENNQAVLAFLENIVAPGDVILVKGSRGVKMEEIIKGLS